MKRIALLGVLLAACSESPTSPYRNLAMVTTVAPATARVGELIQIRTVIRNAGSSAVELRSSDCSLGFEVISGGAIVGPGPATCALALWAPLTLAAGDSLVINAPWRGDTRADAGADPQPLPAGTYSIRGIRRFESTVLTSDAGTIELRAADQ